MLLVALVFPGTASSAVTTGTSTDVPRGTSEVERTTTDVPRIPIYDIDSAKSLQVVVNKQRPLNPVEYLPRGKVQIGYSYVAKPAADAYFLLKAAVAKAKLGTLCINSGYRSFSSQTLIHDAKVALLGKTGGEKLAARPGYSEHQTGLAMDVSTTQLGCRIGSFGASKASKWIAANAWQYGFVVRYPNGKTAITGYVWEPWHLRFVGLELAADMKAKNTATLEEYFALPAAPKY
jgi:D-alanyl-D-alanine carboxypeptidase